MCNLNCNFLVKKKYFLLQKILEDYILEEKLVNFFGFLKIS